MAIILRRRKLGRTSCAEIARLSRTGIVSVRNDKPIPAGHDYLFRWGTTSNIPAGMTVVNDAKAIHWVADKANSRKLMADAGLSPKTWLSFDQFDEDMLGGDHEDGFVFCTNGVADENISFIVRPNVHAQGKNVHHCKDPYEVNEACNLYGEGGYYISEFIDKKSEFRVFVVSGRVACVAKKTPADEKAIAWNVAQGGRFDNVRWGEWPVNAISVAIKAFNMSGLDFGGVDVMVDAYGRAYVLEINSAPSLTSPYRQECMAKCFDYIVENGKTFLSADLTSNDWKDYVHYAVCDKARG